MFGLLLELFFEAAPFAASEWRFLTWTAVGFALTGGSLLIAGLSAGPPALIVVGGSCVALGAALWALDRFFEQRGV